MSAPHFAKNAVMSPQTLEMVSLMPFQVFVSQLTMSVQICSGECSLG